MSEYLGDLEITEQFFSRLKNVDLVFNNIAKVTRGTFRVNAEFDHKTGKFNKLTLELIQRKQHDIGRAVQLGPGGPSSPEAASVERAVKKAKAGK